MTTPRTLQAGDSLEWKYSLSNYPAPTWTLTQTFASPGGGPTIPTQTGVDDDGDHVITIDAATSATLPEGKHQFQVRVTDGSQSLTVDRGTTGVLADLAAVAATDRRTHARKMLDAIEAAMLGNATHEQIAFAFEDVSISHLTPEQVQARYNYWKARVNEETQAENARQGRPNRAVLRPRIYGG